MNSGWLLCLLSFTGPLPQWRTQLLAEAERYATWSWQMEVNNQSCAEVNDYQSDFSLGPQVGVACSVGAGSASRRCTSMHCWMCCSHT